MVSRVRGDDNFDSEASSFTVTTNANGIAHVYNNGWKRQFINGAVTPGTDVSFPVAFTGPVSNITLIGSHKGNSGSGDSDLNVTGSAISTSAYRVRIYSQSGTAITTAATLSIIAEGF